MSKDCCCSCSCAEKGKPRAKTPWIVGYVTTPAGKIPVTTGELSMQDRMGFFRMRLSIGRNDYRVEPGLYALETPDEQSPVLVTANYKMTFDLVRQAMAGRNTWILVLDTKGINVWCAAGKGTFGTAELIKRIQGSELEKIVSHRNVVVPQLGAPGVAAHTVKKETQFKVHYGPVKAVDIPRYLDDGMKAAAEMRRVTFPLQERLILAPVELAGSLKLLAPVIATLLILGGLSLNGFSFNDALWLGSRGFLLYLAGLFSGAVLVPVFLPYIPGRAFSLKGFIAGLIVAGTAAILMKASLVALLSWLFIIGATSSFFAMNFTGATPFTSLSGVKKEMGIAVPYQVALIIAGVILWKISG